MRIPLQDIRPLLTGSPPPLATSMRTGSPAALRRRNRDCQSTRCPCLAATTYAHADPVRSSSTAMGRRAHCTELWHREDLLDWLLSDLRRLGKLAAHVAKLLVLRQSQFFDHTRYLVIGKAISCPGRRTATSRPWSNVIR